MNERASWPLLLRAFHWTAAALIFAALSLGFYMVVLVRDPGERFALTQTHKSIGVTILALTVARLCARVVTAAPKPEPAAPIMLAAAKYTHGALYVLMFLLPLSGWLMVTTTPVRVPTVVFSLFTLPYPLAPDMGTYRVAHALHVACAIALALLLVLHIGAALVHALIWRDLTLARMWRVR